SMTTSQPPPEPLPHVGPILDETARRQRFDPRELAIVLSHYDLGVIEQIRTYARGSARSPKVRIKTRHGMYLLKRRAPGRDDPHRVAFTHSIQLYLADRGYPVPRLIGTRETNNSMLQVGGRIYEVFTFKAGSRYDGSARATEHAGAALAMLHKLLADFKPAYEPPRGSYHAAAGIDARLARIPDAVAAREPDADRAALGRTCASLRDAYHEAAEHVDRTGYGQWPRTVIHGDWHPGNLLYHPQPDRSVAAVLDFDSARLEPLMADVANAALQFSMELPAADEPTPAPKRLDVDRLRRLVRSYGCVAGDMIGSDELAALPWLMTEALILESVIPIAATGSFGHLSGSRFLRMVEGKVDWIGPRAEKLIRHVEGER
ncbi:MAG: phosphotransferase enzyme family protein, partial [Planctomycetota bacterium]